MDKVTLRRKSKETWLAYRRSKQLTEDDRKLLREAYWASALPFDPDYSVEQWVEAGMPDIT